MVTVGFMLEQNIQTTYVVYILYLYISVVPTQVQIGWVSHPQNTIIQLSLIIWWALYLFDLIFLDKEQHLLVACDDQFAFSCWFLWLHKLVFSAECLQGTKKAWTLGYHCRRSLLLGSLLSNLVNEKEDSRRFWHITSI